VEQRCAAIIQGDKALRLYRQRLIKAFERIGGAA